LPTDEEVVRVVQDFCRKNIFEKQTRNNNSWDDYKPSWLREARDPSGNELREERLSRFTHKRIQDEVKQRFGSNDISVEKPVGEGSNLAFDFWNRTDRTAYEVSLGAIKNEFEKDVLKGILDTDTVSLVIFYREYKFGKKGTIFGRKWFAQPSSKEIIERARIFKLNVQPLPLVPDH
jgi:hypothetical protein